MPEDVFATWMPSVTGEKEKAAEQARNAPLEDMARQVKMMQLKNELQASPNIAKLLGGTNQVQPNPQGPVGPQGQQPTTDPKDIYKATTQNASSIWSMATDPNNPRNLLSNPSALDGLKTMLSQKIDFAKSGMLGQQGAYAAKIDSSAPGGIRPLREGEQPDVFVQENKAGTVIKPIAQSGNKLSAKFKDFETQNPEMTGVRQEGDMETYNKAFDEYQAKQVALKTEQEAEKTGKKTKATIEAQKKEFELSPLALESMVQQQVLTGKTPTFSFGAAGALQRKQYNEAYPELVKKVGYADVTNAVLKQFENKANQAALNQTVKMEALSKAYEETAVNFLDRLPELRDRLDLSQYKKLADIEAEYQSGWTGDPDTINLKTQLYEALVESGKVITGQFSIAGMPEGARQRMEEVLQAADKPETYQKVIGTLKLNMRKRNQNLENTRLYILNQMGKSGKEPTANIKVTPDGKRWRKTTTGYQEITGENK